MLGGRKASHWNLFVKKIYHEGHSKNSNYSFKQALQDASKRKHEMNHSQSSHSSSNRKSHKSMNKHKSHRKINKNGGTKRRRKY